MADISRTIEIIFGVSDLDTKKKLDSLEQSFNSLDNVALKVSAPIAGLADRLIHLEEIIIGLGAAFTAFSLEKAGQFQSAQLDLKKVLNETDPSVESFSQTVEELGLKFGQSSTDVLQGIANFKQAGFTAVEAANLQKDALSLVVAGELESKSAAELLISTLKGFQLEAKDSTAVIDSLNEVSNKYATNVAELAKGLAIVSPVAKAMGLTFQQAEGYLTPLIEIFRSGSESGDAFRTILLRLADDNKTVIRSLDALGISQKDANGHLKTGAEILVEVAGKYQTLDKGQAAFLAQNLVGIERSQQFLALMNNWPKTLEVTNVAFNSFGSAAKEVEIRLESFEYTVKRVLVAFEQIGTAFGQAILPQFTDVGKGFIEIEKAFAEIIKTGGLDPLLDAIRPQVERFTSILLEVAKNLPEAFEGLDFSRLIDSFAGLRDEVGGLLSNIFGDIDLTTVEGLQNALQKVIDGVTELTQLVTGIAKYYEPYAASLGEVLNQTNGLTDAQRDSVGTFLGLGKAIHDLGAALGLLGAFLTENQDYLERIGNFISGTVILGVNSAQYAFEDLELAIIGVISSIVKSFDALTFGAFHDKLTPLIEDLDRSWANIREAQNRNIDEGIDGLNRLGKAFTGTTSEADALANKLKQTGDIDVLGSTFSEEKTLQVLDYADATNTLASAFDTVSDKLSNGVYAASIEETSLSINKSLGLVADASQKVSEKIEDLGNGYRKITDANGDLRYTFDKTAESAKYYELQLKDGVLTYVQVEKATANSIKILDENTKATDKAKEADKEAKKEKDALRKAAEDMNLKLAELASKEKIAVIEQLGKIDVAKIEGNTRQIEAAFKSIDNTISSTTGAIDNLYGTYVKTEDVIDKSNILSSIREQEKAQGQALKKQNELIQAQIELLKTRQRRLESRDPLITVKADGIKSHLENIYSEIFKEAQIRASEQGLAVLLGVDI